MHFLCSRISLVTNITLSIQNRKLIDSSKNMLEQIKVTVIIQEIHRKNNYIIAIYISESR